MAIDYDALMEFPFEDREQSYTEKDAILYALGVGLSADPLDAQQLRFTYEDGLRALPTMATVLAFPKPWVHTPASGVTRSKLLHGEQGLTLHRPLPASGRVYGRTAMDAIVDKGPDRGALLYMSRQIFDATTDTLVATSTQTLFCRADGGFGGPSGPARQPYAPPARTPDEACDLPTAPQAALIYRLSGDVNPLHADPKVAQSAGFERPILHGLCVFGIAGHALLRTMCDYAPERLKRIEARFSKPTFPGETIRTLMWREADGRVGFQCRVVERDAIVLDNGVAEIG